MTGDNITRKNNSKCISWMLVAFLIGMAFLYTGAGYLTWLYNLSDLIGRSGKNYSVDILSEVIGYLFQAIGILVSFAYFNKKSGEYEEYNPKFKYTFITMCIVDYVLIILSGMANSMTMVLITGHAMNIMHGVVAAFYLLVLSWLVPSDRRGVTFGFGYAIGSIGTWVISKFRKGNFLKDDLVYLIYALIVIAVIVLILLIKDKSYATKDAYVHQNSSIVIFAGIIIVLFCLLKGIGFYFPMADISKKGVSLELTRTFYAVGLLVAGILNDYRRKWGGIICLSALVIPFVLIFMQENTSASAYIWVVSYAFTGFYTVYRVVLFSDLTCNVYRLLPVSVMGLMFGRIGDAAGSYIGIALSSNSKVLVVVGATIFMISVTLFFAIFARVYMVSNIDVDRDVRTKNDIFKNKYGLSIREAEIFDYVVAGKTNLEIADALYVTESTVKFHVKNILKKSVCSNRKELIQKFRSE